ncbi:hypothetical protein RRF57_006604 [Xylaria bambusicola]|uniref:NACHT domain-containing protein n=1 Tax=Xylaria bambusicola TaxID=326684 RepID=A0AAN7UZJ9_9PEZI
MPRPSFCGIFRRNRRKAHDEGQSATQLAVIARPLAASSLPSAQGLDPANPDVHSTNQSRPSITPPTAPLPSPTQAATDPETLPLSTSGSQPALDAPQVVQAQHERETHGAPERPMPYASNADLWKEALAQLDELGRHNIESLIGELSSEAADTKSLALTIQEQLDVAFKVQQHDTKSGRIIENSLAVLGKFLSVVDVAVSFDPVHAALPWAAVRSVLVPQLVTASRDLEGRLIAGIAIVTSLLAQCDTYQQLYMAPDLPLRPSQAPLSTIKAIIIHTYAKIQMFLSFAIEQQRRKLRLAAAFNVDNAKSHVDELSRCEKELQRAADTCERHCSLSSRSAVQELLNLKADFSKIFRNQMYVMKCLQSAKADLLASDLLMSRFESGDQIKLLEWISPILYQQHHNRVKDDRISGTCEWLLEHDRFREWEDSNLSTILWLQGSPGAGKTFLTSRVIDHERARVESSPNQEGFAFFYCDRNEEQRRKPLSVLQSYVRQLSTTAKNPDCIRKSLQDCCQKARRSGSDLSFEHCRYQLLESINLYHNTTLVLDALDECEPNSRGQILEIIEFLISKSGNSLKVFISSRPDQDIRDRFLKTPNIEIQATDNEEDIQKFVREKITQHRNWRGMSQRLQNDIVEKFFTKSQGMFQWAFLQINDLLALQTERAIRDRLDALPTGLKKAYDEIYEKIKDRNKYDRALADRAFKWVACTYEPLTSEELLSAIRLDSDSTAFDLSDPITESQLLDLCNNLLVIDSQQKVWRFSHLSVIEYFEANHWDLQDAHYHAASVCLKGLIKIHTNVGQDEIDNSDSNLDYDSVNSCTLEKEPINKFRFSAPFETYFNRRFNSILAQLLKSFLGSPTKSSLQYQAWHTQTNDYNWSNDRTRAWDKSELAPATTALFAMCRFSLYDVLLDWWKDAEFDISMTTDSGLNLLALAAIGGCKQMCENLIKRGVEVDIQLQHDKYGSVLAAVASQGPIEIVRFLVNEAGADGKTEIVEFLVKAGADINIQLNNKYSNALAASAKIGQTEIVKFLIKVRANEQTKIVKFLIKAGANVNIQLNGKYSNALTTNTKLKQTKILGNVNIQLNGNTSSTSAMQYRDKPKFVKFLVEVRANVNIQLNGEYGSALATSAKWDKPKSALAAGAKWGDSEIVEFLIKAGADVNIQLNSEYGSALAAAVDSIFDTDAAISTLLQAGADANIQLLAGKHGNALIYAIEGDMDRHLRLLVGNAETDVNQQIRMIGSRCKAQLLVK